MRSSLGNLDRSIRFLREFMNSEDNLVIFSSSNSKDFLPVSVSIKLEVVVE